MTITFPGSGNPVNVDGINYGLYPTLMTAQNASGTSVDFTGIPSWVRRITLIFQGVSTNGTSAILVQIGSGSVQTSGYLGAGLNAADATTSSATNRTSGFGVDNAANAAAVRHGSGTFTLLGSNAWAYQGVFARSDTPAIGFGSGSVTLSGTLDRIRITTVNGTDAFDAGTINVMYE